MQEGGRVRLPSLFFLMDCIVIGNGESLQQTPLVQLAEKFDTFGCNRIHLYPFSPTYYVRVEPPAWNGTSVDFFNECRLHMRTSKHCIFPRAWRETLGDAPNVEYIGTCHHFKYSHSSHKFPRLWHLPFVCDTNAVTAMMQIAVLKGYTRIILVGCDASGAHFSSEDLGIVDPNRLQVVHETARRSCPVPIVNATVGGSLEIYPRIPVESLL